MNRDDEYQDWGTVTPIAPTPEQWRQAAYLELMPYDCNPAVALDIEDGREVHIPLLGRVRLYSVEIVYRDNTWDTLHCGRDLHEAKMLIQASAAKHDLPIRRLFPERSDIEGY